MRKESSNQFTEGLVCDLNPINTPNTVLTDALNATIITYDGNEHSLQNDRGNYQLKNCRLRPNYIPVGLKEYGDILYIVSYNPLNNHVEIGSYPSPLNVESSDEEPTPLEINSIIETINGSANYTDLMKKAKLHLYVGEGDEEQFKLYPGDEYCLNVDSESKHKYEDLEYFVIDENRKRYNVSNSIIADNQYHNIAWEVPGWLAMQYRVGNFEDFNMSVRSFTVPVVSEGDSLDCNASLHFQFKISDKLFLPVLGDVNEVKESENAIKSDVFIKLEISANGAIKKDVDIPLTDDGKFVEWYLDSKILWTKYDTTLEGIDKQSAITITATPIIRITAENVQREIIYDNLIESTTFNINNIGSISDFKIATDLWKFYTDEDSSALQLEYNVSGPNVTTSVVNLFYKVRPIEFENGWTDWKPMEGYGGISDQINSWITFNDSIQPEAIYVICFAFGSDVNNLVEVPKQRILITSKIFGEFTGEKQNFDEITFDEWAINHYKDSLNIGTLTINSSFAPSSTNTIPDHSWNIENDFVKNQQLVYGDTVLRNLWKNEKVTGKGLAKSNSVKEYTKSTVVTFNQPFNCTTTIKTNSSKVYTGKLWDNTGYVTISTNGFTKTITRDKLVGITELAKFELETFKSKTKNYNVVANPEVFRTIGNVQQIKEVPMLWLNARHHHSGMNEQIEFTLRDCGNLKFNDKYDTPTGWDYKNIIKCIINLNENNLGLSNSLASSIVSALGSYQFGVVGLYFESLVRDTGHTWYKTFIKHGGSEVKKLTNGEKSILFTYLVFRSSPSTNYATFVPLSDSKGLWDVLTPENNNVKTWNPKNLGKTTFTEDIIQVVTNIVKNLKIVPEDNALTDYRTLKINTDNECVDSKNLAFVVNIQTNDVRSWWYGDYDLMSNEDRNTLSAEIESNLLKSSINYIPQHIIRTESVSDENSDDNISIVNFETKVININNMIDEPDTEIHADILTNVENATRTRGVYFSSSPYPELGEDLDQSYKWDNDYKHLTLSRAKVGELSITLNDDNNTIILGKVTTSTSIG